MKRLAVAGVAQKSQLSAATVPNTDVSRRAACNQHRIVARPAAVPQAAVVADEHAMNGERSGRVGSASGDRATVATIGHSINCTATAAVTPQPDTLILTGRSNNPLGGRPAHIQHLIRVTDQLANTAATHTSARHSQHTNHTQTDNTAVRQQSTRYFDRLMYVMCRVVLRACVGGAVDRTDIDCAGAASSETSTPPISVAAGCRCDAYCCS